MDGLLVEFAEAGLVWPPAPHVIELPAQGCLPEHRLPLAGPEHGFWQHPHIPVPSDCPQVQAGPLGVPVLLLPLLVISSLSLQPELQGQREGQGCYWGAGLPGGTTPCRDPRRKHAQRACEAAGGLHLLALRTSLGLGQARGEGLRARQIPLLITRPTSSSRDANMSGIALSRPRLRRGKSLEKRPPVCKESFISACSR